MKEARKEIQWSSRVPRWKIKRLYETDAQGLRDDDLLEDVGFSLLQRCKDIVVIKNAKTGSVECPRCANHGQKNVIERNRNRHRKDVRDEVIECSSCGWKITWGEYVLSYKRKQLNAGSTEMFEAYVKNYLAAKSAREKLFAIDRLIHEFHHSLVNEPEIPGRPVCANLLQGKLSDIVVFLNELTFGSSPTMTATKREWQNRMVLQKHRYPKE